MTNLKIEKKQSNKMAQTVREIWKELCFEPKSKWLKSTYTWQPTRSTDKHTSMQESKVKGK